MSAEQASERLVAAPRLWLLGGRESALVRSAQRGSKDAIEELFRRYWRPTHRAAYLIVRDAAAAEDIAQETFLAAIRSLDSFDRRRPFGPWIHRIAVNRAIDWSRTRSLRAEVAVPEPPARDGTENDAPELSQELVAALAGLGPEQRAVVVLRHLLGYSPGEIGRMLELPRGTVNSRLRRALDRLRPLIGEDGR